MNTKTAWYIGAGGGGGTCGGILAGIKPTLAIDWNPKHPKRSQIIASAYEQNFKQPVIQTTIEEFVERYSNWKQLPKPDFLVITLPCSNFSPLSKRRESDRDKWAAVAAAELIEEINPEHIWIENVPNWRNSQSCEEICSTIGNLYRYHEIKVYCSSNFGVPQKRKRLIIRASKKRIKTLSTKQPITWWEAVQDLPEFKGKQVKSLFENKMVYSSRREPRTISKDEQMWTITSAIFTDGKNATRRNNIKVLCENSADDFFLSYRAIARLHSFPDWFILPEKIPGVLIGLSVPPKFAQVIFESFK